MYDLLEVILETFSDLVDLLLFELFFELLNVSVVLGFHFLEEVESHVESQVLDQLELLRWLKFWESLER